MDKKKKIIICVFGIAVGFLLIFGTVYNAKNNLQTNTNVNFMNNTSDTNMRGNRPNDGKNSQMTPPDKNNDSSNDSTDSETNDNTMTPKDNNQRGMTPGSNLQTNFKQISNSLTISSIILVSLGTLLMVSSILYLIMSSLGKNKVFVSKDKILIYSLITVLLTIVLVYGENYYINNKILSSNNNIQIPSTNTNTNSNNSTSTDSSV